MDACSSLSRFYEVFYGVASPHDKAQQVGIESESFRMNLPMFVKKEALPLIQKIMNRKLDPVFQGMCSSPPKGGFSTISWGSHISQNDSVAALLKGLRKEFASLRTSAEASDPSVVAEPSSRCSADATLSVQQKSSLGDVSMSAAQKELRAEILEMVIWRGQLSTRLRLNSRRPMRHNFRDTLSLVRSCSAVHRWVVSGCSRRYLSVPNDVSQSSDVL